MGLELTNGVEEETIEAVNDPVVPILEGLVIAVIAKLKSIALFPVPNLGWFEILIIKLSFWQDKGVEPPSVQVKEDGNV